MNEFLDLNIPFVKLNKKDLNYFLKKLKKHCIEYRKKLNIAFNIYFGIEIEVDESEREEFYYYVSRICPNFFIYETLEYSNYYKDWLIKPEVSTNYGFEIISPVLSNNDVAWNAIKEVCILLKNKNCKVSDKTAAHIHFDSGILENNIETLKNFIILWSVFENIIYRFSYGENLNYRSNLTTYSIPIKNKVLNNYNSAKNCDTEENFIKALNLSFEQIFGIDFHRYISKEHKAKGTDTIEIRCPNGTVKPEIWQNNINFFTHLLLYAKNNNFNFTEINKMFIKLNQDTIVDSLDNYKNIDIKKALKLSDLIFNNNLDKINFLKQYYKNGLESSNFSKIVKLTL